MPAIRQTGRQRGKTATLVRETDSSQFPPQTEKAAMTTPTTLKVPDINDLSTHSHSDLSTSVTSFGKDRVKGRYDFAAKVIMLGDYGVGKTSLLKTLGTLEAQEQVQDDVRTATRCLTYRPNEYVEMECARSDKRVLIRIMDTGGQERFRSMTSSYFRGAHGCLLMFDVAKETSFDNIINWFNNLDMYAAPDHISAVLVGTVCQGNERLVTSERAFKLAEGLQLTYMETDVRDEQMVLWILQKLVNNVIISRARRQSLAISIMPPLKKMPAKKKRFKCCGAS